MRATDVIQADKTNIELGSWATGHVTAKSFPLSKAKAKNYKYGPSYKWRVVKFDALGHKFRVLVLFNQGKGIFRASLGVEVAADMRVLCMHEFHAKEPGWHCHAHLCEAADVDAGVFRGAMRKWPKKGKLPEHQQFGILDETAALRRAIDFYKVETKGALL